MQNFLALVSYTILGISLLSYSTYLPLAGRLHLLGIPHVDFT